LLKPAKHFVAKLLREPKHVGGPQGSVTQEANTRC
jgi:hypothetical protein